MPGVDYGDAGTAFGQVVGQACAEDPRAGDDDVVGVVMGQIEVYTTK